MSQACFLIMTRKHITFVTNSTRDVNQGWNLVLLPEDALLATGSEVPFGYQRCLYTCSMFASLECSATAANMLWYAPYLLLFEV